MAADTVSNITNKVKHAPSVVSFLTIGLLQGITVSILQGILVINWNDYLKPTVLQVPRGYTIPANLAIFIFGFLFQLIFMIDAIRLKSTAQAMLACLLNAGFLPLAVYQRKQMRESIDSLSGSTDANGDSLVHLDKPIWEDVGGILLAMPFVVGICTIFLVISVWYLKQYFDWQAYRNVGADAKLRRIRNIHLIFVMFAKVVIYFIICFEVLYGVTQLRGMGIEFIVRMVLLGVAVVITTLSIVFSKTENRIGMIVSIIIFLVSIAYFIFNIVRIQTEWGMFGATGDILTCYAFMSAVFLLATAIFGMLCLRNFYGGLKEYLEKHEEKGQRAPSVKNFELDARNSFSYQSVRSIRDLDS
ncbi:hypothetical protein FVEN_g266 [Fusarium venenatum]|uniref:TRP C-terminal domain-containing protein n=1 Tax=Fusarium venenatum TaxID=56646 RepID=A0A2L2SYQ2_9HYPO|nr:uncharacterized protein FVRRES_07630 [Fusarium venenatum]KAG8362219.1 hypothetical protein FVEN_g266 [Fusarium venenatum]KAH6994529.1 hypothetical protein EDB82DRAFT_502011 [Fusarium venenatum]CEI63194.1 unnamed protein product [Fusarium venenatum]